MFRQSRLYHQSRDVLVHHWFGHRRHRRHRLRRRRRRCRSRLRYRRLRLRLRLRRRQVSQYGPGRQNWFGESLFLRRRHLHGCQPRLLYQSPLLFLIRSAYPSLLKQLRPLRRHRHCRRLFHHYRPGRGSWRRLLPHRCRPYRLALRLYLYLRRLRRRLFRQPRLFHLHLSMKWLM